MKKILLGTTNEGKQQEYKTLFAYFDNFEVVFPNEIGFFEEPDETGSTFVENSLLKAKYYFEKSGIPTIADDGGLEIKVLHGEPGVASRRWLGYKATDEELINHTLEKLSAYTNINERRAQLTVCLTYFDGKHALNESQSIQGHIAQARSQTRVPGYPFRELFVVNELGKYYSELTKKEHARINHREIALRHLIERISNQA